MPTLWLGGVDAEAVFGLMLSDEGSVLDGMTAVPQEIEVPWVVGSLFVGPATVKARDFVLKGWLKGTSNADVRTKWTALKALVNAGLRTVRVADWSDAMIEATLVRAVAVAGAPAQISDWMTVELTFRAPIPFFRDVNALSYRFDSTPTPMPCGTAAVAPELYGFGPATTPQLKGYDHRGTEEWSATFATLATGEAYKIVTAGFDMALYKKAAGSALWVAADDQTVLTAGVFPKCLFSTSAAYRLSQWPLLSASSGKWLALYPRMWG